MNTRKIALLLSLLLAASAVSCGGAKNPTDTTADTASDVDTTVPCDPSDDDLPALDFKNETVTFLYRAEIVDEFTVEDQNGEVVNDAIYDSHRSVEERLNVNIETITMNGQVGTDRNTYMNHITSTIMANEDAYDWVDLMIGNAPVKMQEGIFFDLAENLYIDVTKPYYLKGLKDLVTVDGKLFFISGDASLGYLQDSFCIIANKRMAEDFGIGNLYELVEKGEWTLDKLMEYSELVSDDTDKDGYWTDSDRLGLRIYDQNHISGFLASTELHMFTEEDGDWKFDMSTQRTVSIMEKLHRLLNETPGSTLLHQQDPAVFADGDVLFMTAQFDDIITYLREMKDPYAVLPYPKFESSQDGYYSNSRTTHNSFSMPLTCQNPDMAGAVMEALSSSNYKTVTPAYYEVALKVKYTVDDESARMFDLIRGGVTLDFGYIFSNVVENPITNVYINSVKEGDFASRLASFTPAVNAAYLAYMVNLRTNLN